MLNGFLKFVAGKWTNTTVSSSNPLPTTTAIGSSSASDCQAGRLHAVRATKSAVAAEFARLQIHNAGDVPLHVGTIQVWGGTAGTHVYSAYKVDEHAAGSPVSGAATNCLLGTGADAGIEVYSRSSATAITTANLLGQVSSALITPSGSALLQSGIQITIDAGETLEVAIGTANVAFTMNVALTALRP